MSHDSHGDATTLTFYLPIGVCHGGIQVITVFFVHLSMDATVTVISRTSLILANCLAIGVTWFTMRRGRGFTSVLGDSERTLASVLLWDGECIAWSHLVTYIYLMEHRIHLLFVSRTNAHVGCEFPLSRSSSPWPALLSSLIPCT